MQRTAILDTLGTVMRLSSFYVSSERSYEHITSQSHS